MAKGSGGTRNYSNNPHALSNRKTEFDSIMNTGDYRDGYFDKSGGYFVIHKDHNWVVDPQKNKEREVIYDAEHFFDGYKLDSGYSIETLKAAINVGVDGITLCDTNGGCLTWEIQDIVSKVSKLLKQESLKSQNIKLGIHVHNDMGLAVINSMVAACEGCTLNLSLLKTM